MRVVNTYKGPETITKSQTTGTRDNAWLLMNMMCTTVETAGMLQLVFQGKHESITIQQNLKNDVRICLSTQINNTPAMWRLKLNKLVDYMNR